MIKFDYIIVHDPMMHLHITTSCLFEVYACEMIDESIQTSHCNSRIPECLDVNEHAITAIKLLSIDTTTIHLLFI